jgi:cell wall-associated NlpC family hydrolase
MVARTSSCGTLSAVFLALLSGACASARVDGTGPVPKPFPMAGPRSSPPVVVAEEPAPAPSAPEPAAAAAPSPAPLNAAVPPPSAADFYALVGTALDLRGAPYRDGGNDPRGFDCSGFTQYVFAQHGLKLPRATRDQFRAGESIGPEELAPGDLLFFTTTAPGASHVAIAVGTDQFVHAPSSTGVVRVERLSSGYWSQRFIGARRIAPGEP